MRDVCMKFHLPSRCLRNRAAKGTDLTWLTPTTITSMQTTIPDDDHYVAIITRKI